jgi:hypothetical protein
MSSLLTGLTASSGVADGDLQEVSGDLKAGDKLVRRGTDELRDGSPLPTRK